jgi:hypothetical protein
MVDEQANSPAAEGDVLVDAGISPDSYYSLGSKMFKTMRII